MHGLPGSSHAAPAFWAFCLSVACVLQSLDYRDPERKDFWDALMVVADAELKEARKQDEVDRARLRGMREPDQDAREDTGVQAAVDIDVQIFLTGEPPNILAAQPVRQQSQLFCDPVPSCRFLTPKAAGSSSIPSESNVGVILHVSANVSPCCLSWHMSLL